MFKKNFIILGILTLISPTLFGIEKVIILGDEDYAPYSYTENGQLKGIYVDILKLVAKKLSGSYQIELRGVPWKRGLSELNSGTTFALFPPYRRKERTYISSYSKPLYRESIVIFCNEDVMKFSRKVFPDDFNGLTIGINAGFSLSDALIEAKKNGKIKTEEAKGNDANIKKLLYKRIDCYANDRASILFTLKKLRKSAEFKNINIYQAVELSGEEAFLAFSANFRASYKDDFIHKFNSALEETRKSGEIHRIIDHYLK